MAIINVRRVRDAFVRAEVTDEAKGLELATTLDEELTGPVATTEQFETLEGRIDDRLDRLEVSIRSELRVQFAEWNTRFAQAETQAERRMLRLLLAVIASQALFASVIAILMAVL